MNLPLFASPYFPLLTPEQQKAAQQQMMMGAALGLLQASGPSDRRTSLGQALASGAQSGMAMRNQFSQGALQATELGRRDTERKARDATLGLFRQNPNMDRQGLFGLLGQSESPEMQMLGISERLKPNDNEYLNPVEGVDAAGNPVFFQPSKAGGAPRQLQGVAPKPKDTAEQTFSRENTLRDEFVAQSKDFKQREEAFQNIRQAAADPSGAGDITMVYNFVHMIEPGLAVREGEFANAEQAGGAYRDLLNMYNRIVDGQRLNPAARADIADTAARMMANSASKQEGLSGRYSDLAARAGGSPRNVVEEVDPSLPRQGLLPPKQMPRVGEERDGYRFLGGNPADPNSWRKI